MVRKVALSIIYHARPTGKVPGRGGMTWEEETWIELEFLRNLRKDRKECEKT